MARAATSLSPITCAYLPKRVKASTKCAMMATARKMKTGIGTPNGRPLAQEHDRVRHAIDRLAVGEDEAEPARDAQHAEGHDEGRDADLGIQHAVDEAAERADREAGDDRDRPRQAQRR